MDHRIKLEQDEDAVIIELPDGKEITVWLNDMECDALPQLHIELPEEMCANCWIPGCIPATPLKGSKNALLATEIHIPIENAQFGQKFDFDKVEASAKKRLEYLRTELQAERISYEELAELQSLVQFIDPDDVELLEAAGVDEQERRNK